MKKQELINRLVESDEYELALITNYIESWQEEEFNDADYDGDVYEFMYDALANLTEEYEKENAKKEKFNEIESAFEQMESVLRNYTDSYKSHKASTGTYYYNFSKNEVDYVVRFADHSDCYCTSDYNVAMTNDNSDGMTIDEFKQLLKNLN